MFIVGTLPQLSSLLPRVQHAYGHRLEVRPVAGDDNQSMDESRRGNQRVAVGSRIGDVERRASPRDRSVDGQNALGKGGSTRSSIH